MNFRTGSSLETNYTAGITYSMKGEESNETESADVSRIWCKGCKFQPYPFAKLLCEAWRNLLRFSRLIFFFFSSPTHSVNQGPKNDGNVVAAKFKSTPRLPQSVSQHHSPWKETQCFFAGWCWFGSKRQMVAFRGNKVQHLLCRIAFLPVPKDLLLLQLEEGRWQMFQPE